MCTFAHVKANKANIISTIVDRKHKTIVKKKPTRQI